MAQGPWDTGTWDAALWDSLPVTGNSASGGVGSLGSANSPVLAGVAATGGVGTLTAVVTASVTGNAATGEVGSVAGQTANALSGVQATGQVGSESESDTVNVTGVQASGQVGTPAAVNNAAITGVYGSGDVGSVANSITLAISGVSATGDVGTVTYVPPLVILDTHDGDKKKTQRFKQEREDRERRKQDLIRVYEQLVEGRPEIVHKLVEDFVEPTNYVAAQQRLEPIINFDKLINSLSTVEALYKEHQEMDDEDVLLLL